jgi:hypothetical protein
MRGVGLLLLVECLWVGSAAAQQGYLRTRIPGTETCLSWVRRQYTYSLHSAGSSKTPADTELVAIDAAFATWRALAQECSDFRFEKGPSVAVAEVGYRQGSGAVNANVITFREQDCAEVVPANDPCLAAQSCANVYQCWDHAELTIALTTTTYDTRTGQIYDADIELNAAPHSDGSAFLFTTASSPPCTPESQEVTCVATDVQNTVTHEIGHAIGLDHVAVDRSTMEASAQIGETHKRNLDPGTGQGFCDIYPVSNPTPPCGPVDVTRRKLVAVSRGTAGLEGLGCASAGAGSLFLGSGWVLGSLLRRRRRR